MKDAYIQIFDDRGFHSRASIGGASLWGSQEGMNDAIRQRQRG